MKSIKLDLSNKEIFVSNVPIPELLQFLKDHPIYNGWTISSDIHYQYSQPIYQPSWKYSTGLRDFTPDVTTTVSTDAINQKREWEDVHLPPKDKKKR